MKKICSLISNSITNLENTEKYAAIIGENPSSGARSPKLWDAAFKDNKIDAVMHPFDVTRDNLNDVLVEISSDNNFIGGAVAVPYKTEIALWLGEKNLTKEAHNIGAVNCIFKDENGILKGTNTDGAAALKCLENQLNNLKNKSIIQLGCGGAGRAVAAYIAGNSIKLDIAARYRTEIDDFTKKINASLLDWNNFVYQLDDYDVIINTTSIGFQNINDSPLEQKDIKKLRKNKFFYDIIYDPCPSKLLLMAKASGHDILDGLSMNLEQAILGFDYATKGISDISVTSASMQKVF